MSTGTAHEPGPPRFVATVGGQEYLCEAPFSARVRLLTPEGRQDVPREDVDRIDGLWTTARWRKNVPVRISAASPSGWVVVDDPPSGHPVRQVVVADELDDVRTHRFLVLRRRPGWVLPPDPDPTVAGPAVRAGDRVLPAGEPLAGLLPVRDVDGERLVELAEVDEVTVSTSVRVDGARWEVVEVDGQVATVTSPGHRTRQVSVHDVVDVVEEVRGAPPRTRQVEDRTPVVARPRLTGPGDVVTWAADTGPEHRELRDLVAHVHRTKIPELVALVEELLPRLRSADPARDEAIGWLWADWTLRTLTPLWLDAAGVPSADLGGAAPVTGPQRALALRSALHGASRQVEDLRVLVRRGPRDDLEAATWRVDRSGGPADTLLRVSRVGLHRAVGRDTAHTRDVTALMSSAAHVRHTAARVVQTRGVAPAVRPRLASAVASVADLVRAAAGA